MKILNEILCRNKKYYSENCQSIVGYSYLCALIFNRHKMRKIELLLIVLSIFSIQQLFAWGQEGHRIIGQVAYDNLSKKAKKNVDKVLGKQGIVYWANWADEIKSDTIYPLSYDWHFQDIDGGLSDSLVLTFLTNYPVEGGNLFCIMDSLENVLRENPSDFDALRFIVHLMGDFFCPMHIAHFDDKGGNKVSVQWFGKNANLHRIWDSDLIQSRGYSYSEYANCLENSFRNEKKSIEKMSEEELLLHNYQLCEDVYAYQETWDKNTYHYIYHFASAMEWQLYASGIRLAKLLNELYG